MVQHELHMVRIGEKMKKRILRFSLLILVVALSIMTGACSDDTATSTSTTSTTSTTTTPTASPTVITLSFGSTVTDPHPYALADMAWIEKIESETNGRVKIEYYPGGTLAPKRTGLTFTVLSRPGVTTSLIMKTEWTGS